MNDQWAEPQLVLLSSGESVDIHRVAGGDRDLLELTYTGPSSSFSIELTLDEARVLGSSLYEVAT